MDEEKIKKLDAKINSIKMKKKKERKGYLIKYLVFYALMIILYYAKVPLGIILPMFVGVTMIIPAIILNPLEVYDRIIIKIYESIELLKLSETDPNHRITAYENFRDTMKQISFSSEDSAPWYSKVDDVTDEFIKNLQSLVSPAIREGDIDYNDLIDIALVFISSDINDITILNKQIDEKLGNISFKSDEPDNIIKNIISYMTSIYSIKLVKAILSITGGFTVAFLLSYIFLRAGHKISPDTIYVGGTALTILFSYVVSLTKEKIFSIREDKRSQLKWTKER